MCTALSHFGAQNERMNKKKEKKKKLVPVVEYFILNTLANILYLAEHAKKFRPNWNRKDFEYKNEIALERMLINT